jgi:hypothetical protein
VLIDPNLNSLNGAITVMSNSAEAAAGTKAGIPHPVGSKVPVNRRSQGIHFVESRNVPPSEVLVLVNHP